ncbi:BZ3500_MvSof-1268-A1-R1_Chr6-2g08436 [Microbotryum saponariae]|uniref:BZ3500_MvSof-1268-A1-R1_Chr6-2g08436 protein n=1 Tax=Microbotryum saponariae TaxID=289078 RepID=A0A2X0MFZ2_9BASI|nr:BZ3500_MvSof-1268-A1-R1_Chr6-2g08436 [Microbotryum saponariae]SDA07713.1 BZ3501_MvSof-1269-A2-R1_Chr6-1g08150 [Microbotryum saponariae]
MSLPLQPQGAHHLPQGLDDEAPSASSSPSPPPSPHALANSEPFSNLKADERHFEDQKKRVQRKARLVMGEPIQELSSSATANGPPSDVVHEGEALKDNEALLADVPDDALDLELTHQRLSTLSGLDLHRFTQVERISLRQNLLTSLSYRPLPPPALEESIPTIASDAAAASATATAPQHRDEIDEDELDDPDAKKKEDEFPYHEVRSGEEQVQWPLRGLKQLEEIDLYDNSLKSVKGLENLPSLKSLDLSFNLLRSISELEDDSSDSAYAYPELTHLYLIQNKLPRIQGVRHRTNLTYLEFGGNRIRSIENLPISSNLRSLFLGKNKITKIEGLEGLTGLRTLSIQSNRLTKIEGLETLTSLDELYLSHNGLTELSGLEHNTQLTTLDIGHNKISTIASTALKTLVNLTEFWANDNQLTELPEIESKELETVYLEGNPLQKELGGNYERRIMYKYPSVKQVDAVYLKRS